MSVISKTAKPMMSTYDPLLATVATVKVTGRRWVTGWPAPFVPRALTSKR